MGMSRGIKPSELRALFLFVLYETLGFKEIVARCNPQFVAWVKKQNGYPPDRLFSQIMRYKKEIISNLIDAGVVQNEGTSLKLTEHGEKFLSSMRIDIPPSELIAEKRRFTVLGQSEVLGFAIKFPGLTNTEVSEFIRTESSHPVTKALVAHHFLVRFFFWPGQMSLILIPTLLGEKANERERSSGSATI